MEKLKEILEKAKKFERYITVYKGVSIMTNYDQLSEKCLEFTDEELAEIMSLWNAAEARNDEVRKANSVLYAEAMAEIKNFCKIMGIDTYKRSTSGRVIGEHKDFKILKNKIEAKIPLFCPYSKPYPHEIQVGEDRILNTFSPCTIINIVETARRWIKQKEEAELKTNKLLVKSIQYTLNAIQYATENGIDIEGLSNIEIINKINAIAMGKYIKAVEAEANEMQCGCDECGCWTPGNHRCN